MNHRQYVFVNLQSNFGAGIEIIDGLGLAHLFLNSNFEINVGLIEKVCKSLLQCKFKVFISTR